MNTRTRQAFAVIPFVLLAACGGRVSGDPKQNGSGADLLAGDAGAGAPAPSPTAGSTGSGSSATTTTAIPEGDAGPGPTPGLDADPGPPPPPPSSTPIDPTTQVVSPSGGCETWEVAQSRPFVADSSLSSLPASSALNAGDKQLMGAWIGHAVAPFGYVPSHWDLNFAYFPSDGTSGTYSASTPDSYPPFYYGEVIPACADMYKIHLTDVAADGTLSGGLEIPALMPGPNCLAAFYAGALTSIQFDASHTRLRFSYTESGTRDPINYDMYRACPKR